MFGQLRGALSRSIYRATGGAVEREIAVPWVTMNGSLAILVGRFVPFFNRYRLFCLALEFKSRIRLWIDSLVARSFHS